MRALPRVRVVPLLALAAGALWGTGCLFFEDTTCSDPNEPGCTTGGAGDTPLLQCEGVADPRCKSPNSCRPDPTQNCPGGSECPRFCLPPAEERPACSGDLIIHDCVLRGGASCSANDDCASGVCFGFEAGRNTCMTPCDPVAGHPTDCPAELTCRHYEPPDRTPVDACGSDTTARCASDRDCVDAGLGRCVVKNGDLLDQGLAVAICAQVEGEDDTGWNCSEPSSTETLYPSDDCPVRGLCYRTCRNNSSEACKQGFCARPCERDADCPDRLFCLPFKDEYLSTYFPGASLPFKICQLQDNVLDYGWGCKDDVDCCSGLETFAVDGVDYPVEFGFWPRDAEFRRCCNKNPANDCDADPYSVETHCGLVATPGGRNDQPPPRVATQCRSNRDEPVALALPGEPCLDGSTCLTRLCVPGPAGGVCSTPCYTEDWPRSPERPPTCPDLPDGTARVCCPGRVPFFDLDGVGRSCAAGETCPAGTDCWDGSCQLCVATCQLGDACPAGLDPSCPGPL